MRLCFWYNALRERSVRASAGGEARASFPGLRPQAVLGRRPPALRTTLERAGCDRDEIPVRQVTLPINRDVLMKRLAELEEEDAPDDELEVLLERIERGDRELRQLRGEEE